MSDGRTIKKMKRGEIAYTQSWARDLSFDACDEPCGTADTRVRRKWWGFEFVDRPRDPARRFFIALAVVYFSLLIGGLAVMWITRSVTGDAADPPIGVGMLLAWAVMTIIGLGGALSAQIGAG